MKSSGKIKTNPKALKSLALDFSEASQQALLLDLQLLARQKQFDIKLLNELQSTLLFIRTHANNQHILETSELVMQQITRFMKRLGLTQKQSLNDTFLPFTQTSLIFSYTFIKYLHTQPDCKLSFDGLEADSAALNNILRCTLPNAEKEVCTIGYEIADLWNVLKIKKGHELDFLLQQLDAIPLNSLWQDFAWDQLKIWTRIVGHTPSFSKFFNRFEPKEYFFTETILKRFDPMEWYQKPLPLPEKLSNADRKHVIEVIKKSMVHSMRETDPSTYMAEKTLKVYSLERGISIALFDVTAQRQLPFQSYIGYTLFKNGYPMAYGGSWIIGEKAHFGINIFESYRGGESAFMMCQLLRTYIQLFNLKNIEVDAYQFGKNNEDGIQSAAFWFYYRFGFRPMDKSLASLAQTETKKMSQNKEYRSHRNTLLKLAESNMSLSLGEVSQSDYAQILPAITSTIAKKFNGNRAQAILAGKEVLKEIDPRLLSKHKDHQAALSELALLAITFQSKFKNGLLKRCATLYLKKATDYLGYQKGLKMLLNSLV